MKPAIMRMTVALFAAALWIAVPARAVTVLQNNPALAGLDVVTNAMGTSSFFPDACTNFTIEAWIKPTAYQTSGDVFSPVFSVTPSNKSGYSRYIFGLRQHKLSLFQATVTSGDRFPVSSSDIALDTWTHVAVARTGSEVKFYVNGALDNTATGSFLPPVGEYQNSHLTIGGYYSVESLNGNNSYGTARVFQGSLADVRVWTKARTAEEIAADCRSRLRGDEEGLLLYAPFDDANGTVAHDRVSGQSLVAPPTMQFVEDVGLSLAPASVKLIGGGYLASTRTGGNQGASAIVTDIDLVNKANGTGPDFTFETWLRVPQQEANDQWIFSKYAASGNVGWIGLDIRGGTLKPEVIISGSSTVRHTLDADLPTNEWVHLAATRSGDAYCIYTNGVLAQSGTCQTAGFSESTAAAPVKLLNAGTNKSFGGDVKEMRIWNVARTAEQIAAYFDKASTGREEGLAGCWHMDEGYGSKVRNAVTGTEQSVAVGGMGLVRGSYLVTTGPKQTLVTDAKLTTSDFTLEAWVRDDAATRGGNGRGYMLSQFQSGKDWVSLCFNGPGNQKPGLRISSNKFFESSKAVEKGKWFHLAGTREGSTVKVYLNGELVNTTTYDGALGVPSANLTFFDLSSSGAGHVGGIREARAWSYARTQAQIQQCMFGGIVGNEEGLVGWWPFDQDASATRVLNRKSNDIGKYIPTGAAWGNDGVPLLFLPDLGDEAELAANFGGGWFSVARTGIHVDAADFTFEAWVRPDAYPFDQSYLFAQYKEGESNPSRFLMGFHDTGRFGFFIGGTDGAGNAGGWKETDDPIPLGRWTHLAATRQGSTLRLYVDGSLAKTFENYTTLSPWSSDYPHDLTLGGVAGSYAYSSGTYSRNNISRSFAGAMREARVWNVARSAEDIAKNYNRRVQTSEAGLVGYWPLDGADEGGATRLANKHGHAVGFIVAGWETIEPLRLKDPRGPFVLIVR